MNNKFQTGLAAGIIGFFAVGLLVGIGLLMGRSSADRPAMPGTMGRQAKASAPASSQQSAPPAATEVTSPERAQILKAIKDKLGDPSSLEVISWQRSVNKRDEAAIAKAALDRPRSNVAMAEARYAQYVAVIPHAEARALAAAEWVDKIAVMKAPRDMAARFKAGHAQAGNLAVQEAADRAMAGRFEAGRPYAVAKAVSDAAQAKSYAGTARTNAETVKASLLEARQELARQEARVEAARQEAVGHEYAVIIAVYRAKNNVGAMAVYWEQFGFTDGKMNSSGPRYNTDQYPAPLLN